MTEGSAPTIFIYIFSFLCEWMDGWVFIISVNLFSPTSSQWLQSVIVESLGV